MEPDPILEELRAVKAKLAIEAGYDVDRFVENLRHWETEHPQSGRVIRNAEELRLTPRISFFDSTTGERVGFFDAFGAGDQACPTLVAASPCCMGAELRLNIQRLASGLIQISANGDNGRNYELQKSQNLISWDKLSELRLTNPPVPYTDPESQSNPARFYRSKLRP